LPGWLFGGSGFPFGPGGVWGSNTPEDAPWAASPGADGDVEDADVESEDEGEVEV
jgi:hypothetical protein